jgi:hypothetical protein
MTELDEEFVRDTLMTYQYDELENDNLFTINTKKRTIVCKADNEGFLGSLLFFHNKYHTDDWRNPRNVKNAKYSITFQTSMDFAKALSALADFKLYPKEYIMDECSKCDNNESDVKICINCNTCFCDMCQEEYLYVRYFD